MVCVQRSRTAGRAASRGRLIFGGRRSCLSGRVLAIGRRAPSSVRSRSTATRRLEADTILGYFKRAGGRAARRRRGSTRVSRRFRQRPVHGREDLRVRRPPDRHGGEAPLISIASYSRATKASGQPSVRELQSSRAAALIAGAVRPTWVRIVDLYSSKRPPSTSGEPNTISSRRAAQRRFWCSTDGGRLQRHFPSCRFRRRPRPFAGPKPLRSASNRCHQHFQLPHRQRPL